MENDIGIQETNKSKIIFGGVKNIDAKIARLIFIHELTGAIVEVPIERRLADHIMLYLGKISNVPIKPVERGNDEPL